MSQCRLAIVDDEPHIAELLTMAAEDAGFDVESFTDPEEFLGAVVRERYDLVVTDLMMPRFDGVQLIHRLAALEKPPRVVLASGAMDGTRRCAGRLARDAGLDIAAEFGKPIDMGAFADCLSRLSMAPQAETGDHVVSAIDRGELVLHYQPVFRARRGEGPRLAEVEALVRWQHPERGLLLPGAFLHQVEAPADWERLTLAVLDMACAQIAEWRSLGFEPNVAVNVPPLLLAADDFPDKLDAVRERHGTARDRLVIEVVEAADYGCKEAAAGLTRLQLRGYTLSIDDFGTGHSTLERLYNVPFNQLKVDVGFVARAHRDPVAHSIVASSVALARKLGLAVCAEGVEDVDVLHTMVDLDVDYLQGFGLCRPMAAPLIEAQFNAG